MRDIFGFQPKEKPPPTEFENKIVMDLRCGYDMPMDALSGYQM